MGASKSCTLSTGCTGSSSGCKPFFVGLSVDAVLPVWIFEKLCPVYLSELVSFPQEAASILAEHRMVMMMLVVGFRFSQWRSKWS